MVLGGGLAQTEERAGVVDGEAGAGFDGNADAGMIGKGSGLAPVGDEALLPLPGEGGEGARGGQGVAIQLGVRFRGGAAGAAREGDDGGDVEALGEADGLAEDGVGLLRDAGDGMHGVGVAGERAEGEAGILKAHAETRERGLCWRAERRPRRDRCRGIHLCRVRSQ